MFLFLFLQEKREMLIRDVRNTYLLCFVWKEEKHAF